MAKDGGLDVAVMTNPYIQSIQIAINQVDAEIASINSRVDIFTKRLQKAQDELNSRLSIETEIENLNTKVSEFVFSRIAVVHSWFPGLLALTS